MKPISIQALADQNDCYKFLFLTVCTECINMCHQCGQDIGYGCHPLSTVGDDCVICNHQSCRSCGINIKCLCCNQTACIECIKNHAGEGCCRYLRKRLRMIEKTLEKKSKTC